MVSCSKKIKILQVVSVSFSLRYFIGNQFAYFKEKGVDYTVACSPSEDFDNYAKEMSFKPFPIHVKREISPITDLKTIFRLYRLMRQEKFDIIIAHSPKGGLLGMIAGWLARAPKRIFFRHGLVFETAGGLTKWMLIWIERLTAFLAHTVVNVSPSIRQKSIEYKLNADRKNLILGKGTCNGIDCGRFKPRTLPKEENVQIVGFVGRLCSDKGINELVAAWSLLRKGNTSPKLLLIGPVDQRDPLPESTLALIRSDSSIELIGEVNDTEFWYNKMDVFVLPSYREGFSTVLLEASASGIPIVTTAVTGCVDAVIAGVTGLLVSHDPIDIADKISYYLQNPDVARGHGINGRQNVLENFSEEIIYKEISEKVIGRHITKRAHTRC